jgi:hypothetical protein
VKINKNAAVEITAADEVVLKEYVEMINTVTACEIEMRAALYASIAMLAAQPYDCTVDVDTSILIKKTDYQFRINAIYETHERMYDVLEKKLRELRNDKTVDLDKYRQLYLERMEERVAM